MKRVLSALLLSVLCFSLYAEEIEFHALYSLRGTDGVNAAYFFHDKAIIEHTHDSGKLEEYDFSTRTLKVVPIDEKVHVLGQQGPKLLFWYDTEDSEGNIITLASWYDMVSGERSEPFERKGILGAFFYYQDYAGFTSLGPESDWHMYLVNVKTGEKKRFEDLPKSMWTEPTSISPDRLRVNAGSGFSEGMWNAEQEKYETIVEKDIGGIFLTNNLLYSYITYSSEIRLWNTKFQELESVRFLIKDKSGEESYGIWFSPDLKYAVVEGMSRSINTLYILDTTSFRDYLDSKNLLFRPTTAVSTESRVRVRENPNLEAQTFGYLEKGDELEVTDRSGVKVKIGDMKDWWYKIKRKSDGLEGWAYGYFLKLASYQGELGLK